jgi:hypothetical protein
MERVSMSSAPPLFSASKSMRIVSGSFAILFVTVGIYSGALAWLKWAHLGPLYVSFSFSAFLLGALGGISAIESGSLQLTQYGISQTKFFSDGRFLRTKELLWSDVISVKVVPGALLLHGIRNRVRVPMLAFPRHQQVVAFIEASLPTGVRHRSIG